MKKPLVIFGLIWYNKKVKIRYKKQVKKWKKKVKSAQITAKVRFKF